jgi:hypothetical protein
VPFLIHRLEKFWTPVKIASSPSPRAGYFWKLGAAAAAPYAERLRKFRSDQHLATVRNLAPTLLPPSDHARWPLPPSLSRPK